MIEAEMGFDFPQLRPRSITDDGNESLGTSPGLPNFDFDCWRGSVPKHRMLSSLKTSVNNFGVKLHRRARTFHSGLTHMLVMPSAKLLRRNCPSIALVCHRSSAWFVSLLFLILQTDEVITLVTATFEQSKEHTDDGYGSKIPSASSTEIGSQPLPANSLSHFDQRRCAAVTS
jgi:hypothetical protein